MKCLFCNLTNSTQQTKRALLRNFNCYLGNSCWEFQLQTATLRIVYWDMYFKCTHFCDIFTKVNAHEKNHQMSKKSLMMKQNNYNAFKWNALVPKIWKLKTGKDISWRCVFIGLEHSHSSLWRIRAHHCAIPGFFMKEIFNKNIFHTSLILVLIICLNLQSRPSSWKHTIQFEKH